MGIGWSAVGKKFTSDYSKNNSYQDAALSFLLSFILGLPGIVLTALALLLGAPFWFDMLNKLINVRNSGKKPTETK